MLLENGADPNVTDKLESTPLHRASAKGNYRLIQLLLKQRASTNIQDSQGNTPLYGGDNWYFILKNSKANSTKMMIHQIVEIWHKRKRFGDFV